MNRRAHSLAFVVVILRSRSKTGPLNAGRNSSDLQEPKKKNLHLHGSKLEQKLCWWDLTGTWVLLKINLEEKRH